ncbi:MAG: 30S ribosomal protein S21 [Patescibacteria group bacterium]|nr:30S ribosomal protein S21 [Patescibacteria group bacterium]
MEIKRKEGESISAFLYRFSKKMQQSGVLKEAKKRKHKKRNINKTKIRANAIYRSNKKEENEKARKMGLR